MVRWRVKATAWCAGKGFKDHNELKRDRQAERRRMEMMEE